LKQEFIFFLMIIKSLKKSENEKIKFHKISKNLSEILKIFKKWRKKKIYNEKKNPLKFLIFAKKMPTNFNYFFLSFFSSKTT